LPVIIGLTTYKLSRILAIDYGSKRVGLAVSDPLQMIATGLAALHSKDVIPYLKTYLKKEPVGCFVIGEPRQMDNTPSESARLIVPFINLLKKNFPEVAIARMDERFTSKIAVQTLVMGGVKKKERQNKNLLDEISATIILQSYMELKKKDPGIL
jgi:putative Holliday junction resolvase